jgi:hypothetical protein
MKLLHSLEDRGQTPNEHNQGHVIFCEICLLYVGPKWWFVTASSCTCTYMFAARFILTSTLQYNATIHPLMAAILQFDLCCWSFCKLEALPEIS